MRKSENIAELAKALCDFQAEKETVKRDGVNPYHSSAYATFDQIVKVTSPLLSKHGLAVTQPIETQENGDVILTTVLLHKSGEWIESDVKLLVDKNNMQGLGSAITYARRYGFSSILGLATEADDDGNGAVTGKASDKQNKAPLSKFPSIPEEPKGPVMAQPSQISQLNTYLAAGFIPKDRVADALAFTGAKEAKTFAELTEAQAGMLIDRLRTKEIEANKAKAEAKETAGQSANAPLPADDEEDVPYDDAGEIAWLGEHEETVNKAFLAWNWISEGQTWRDLPPERVKVIKNAPERIASNLRIPAPKK